MWKPTGDRVLTVLIDSNPCRIFRNVSRIVRQFGGIISIIGVSFKR
ncbi:hypothetical protein BvCmsKSNP018_00512 [Escherichia coli]|nr:hypothetical protein BvCmsKSNP018_00512 [Escherichia coli]GDL79136.1 hypothetical protein BvCmsKSNP073_03586 [Escherichia coli]GDM83840.1 hypothetical protein BvCmsNSNP024_03934 [Escherichia coli]